MNKNCLKVICNPYLAGLLQAAGVFIYAFLIIQLMFSLENISVAPEHIAAPLMLFLFVISAAITALMVFGYPAYLALKNNMKKALYVLGFTFLYSIIIFFGLLMLISIYN